MSWKRIILVLVNLIVCFSFGFGVLIFYKVAKPYVRGYYCDDNSINKPFKDNTVTVPLLVAATFTLSLFSFIVIQASKLCKIYGKSYLLLLTTQKKKLLINVLISCGIYLYGTGITVFVTDVGKYSIGRLRPHFYSVCDPDWSQINCTNSKGLKNFIVGDEFCKTEDLKKLKDARLSFPSGHASFAVFSASFLIFYLESQLAFAVESGFVLKLCAEVILAVLALYCGLSRVSDYKHHPTDVLAGSMLGFLVACVVSIQVLNQILPKKRSSKEEDIMTHKNVTLSYQQEV